MAPSVPWHGNKMTTTPTSRLCPFHSLLKFTSLNKDLSFRNELGSEVVCKSLLRHIDFGISNPRAASLTLLHTDINHVVLGDIAAEVNREDGVYCEIGRLSKLISYPYVITMRQDFIVAIADPPCGE
jgi:hypothetical protein